MMLDPEVVEHESAQAAMATLCGLEVSHIDAIGGQTYQGQLRYFKAANDDQRTAEIKTLFAGGDIPTGSGFPPNDTVRDSHDLAHLRRLMTEMRIDASRYYRLKAQAEELMTTPRFQTLKTRFADALVGSDGVLDEQAIGAVIRRWEWDTAET